MEAASSLASEGMHTRSPISRICAELYGTAMIRPLLMHTPPCLPIEQGSSQRESTSWGTLRALIDGFDSPGEVGCGELPEEADLIGLRIELDDRAAAPWDAIDVACAGGRHPVKNALHPTRE